MENIFDLIILGAGPGGLAGGLYGARGMMKTLVIEKNMLVGGQISTTSEIENYPGGMIKESGMELTMRMKEQATNFGCEFVTDSIASVDLLGDIKTLVSETGVEYKAKSVIIATGAVPRLVGAPGEKEYTGRGISYCATCDAFFIKGLEVFVIGGGDTAVEEAIYLTKFAKKVNIVHRRDQLRAAKSIQEKAFKNDKINFIWDTVVEEFKGDPIKGLESIVLKNKKTGEITEYNGNGEAIGVFVLVGNLPNTSIFGEEFKKNDSGYFITDEKTLSPISSETGEKIDGVYIVGDCREKSLYQVITATADGAIAAVNAEKYVEEKFN
jgi:thioredoxin reductase (NADPH)